MDEGRIAIVLVLVPSLIPGEYDLRVRVNPTGVIIANSSVDVVGEGVLDAVSHWWTEAMKPYIRRVYFKVPSAKKS